MENSGMQMNKTREKGNEGQEWDKMKERAV